MIRTLSENNGCREGNGSLNEFTQPEFMSTCASEIVVSAGDTKSEEKRHYPHGICIPVGGGQIIKSKWLSRWRNDKNYTDK